MRMLFTFAAVAVLSVAAQAQQRVEVSRDLWISSYATEVEGNNGASPKLKLKGIQEFFLIDFDPTPLRGKRVRQAWLHVHLTSREHPLQRTTASTVAQDWVEGTGTGYQKVPGASSFVWSRTGETSWLKDQPDITAVINSEGGSAWGFGDVSPPDAQGWQVIPIAPEVVQARLDGRSFGFAVMDDVGSEYTRNGNAFAHQNFVNRYVSSREDRREHRPFFTIWFGDGPATKPKPAALAPAVVSAAKMPKELPALRTPSAAPPVPCRDEFGELLKSLQFFAAKGETIGFIVGAKTADVRASLPGASVRLFAMPKVGGHQDPLVPAGFDAGGLDVDLANTETFVELHIPKTASPGLRQGELSVGGKSVPLELTVWNFTLPDKLSFLAQMNAYGLPSHVRDYYRLAQEHRTTLNQLPYGWTGKLDDPPPVIRADGTWDWTAYDAAFGPLLDGSAFAGLPRAGTPVEAYYLMLNENWPMKHDTHFRGGYWVENAFAEGYWKEFRRAAAEVAKHFEAKGWTEPMLEFYLNNKVYFKKDDWRKCTAAWVFDEPVNTQDFWALRHYGMEFWQAVAPWKKISLTYRADISRPQWQRDLLDHCVNVEVVSGALRTWWPRVNRRAEECGNLVYMYGGANAIGTPNIANAAWCVESWSLGADGVVPWNTIGGKSAWTTPDELSVIYPTSRGPVPSLRLKTFRAGQQLVEYLTQFAIVSGQPRANVMAAVRGFPGLSAKLVKRSEEDAGKSQFGPETHRAFTSLRLQLGHWLDSQSPAPRDRWHDLRPKRPDISLAPQKKPLAAPVKP